jgi:hypothetical protein
LDDRLKLRLARRRGEQRRAAKRSWLQRRTEVRSIYVFHGPRKIAKVLQRTNRDFRACLSQALGALIELPDEGANGVNLFRASPASLANRSCPWPR